MVHCFWCLVEWQARKRENIRKAFTVYNGVAHCYEHINTKRGIRADFERYPLEALEED